MIDDTLNKDEKVTNIMAFLLIIFGETDFIDRVINFSPGYLIEKYERFVGFYVASQRDEYLWGLHPNLRDVFNSYAAHWKLGVKND